MGKVSFTTKGYIEVWWLGPSGFVFLSRHRQETEAIEALTLHASTQVGDQSYELRFPGKTVKVYGITSPGGDTIAPTVPQGLQATTQSAVSIELRWTASTDNVGVEGYQVWRGGTPIQNVVGTVYTDVGLQPSTPYTYHVSAYDAAGNVSGLSSPATATTAANGAPVWNVGQQELTTSVGYSLNLTTVCSDPNGTVPEFSIVSGTLPAGVDFNTQARTVSGTPSAVETQSVTFRASDGVATTDQAITFRVLNADVTAPNAPTGLAGNGTGGERIELTWSAATDPTVANARTSGVTAYKLYRDGALRVTLGNVLAYSDTQVSADTQYSYTVSAVDAAGNESAQSTAVLVSTAAFGWTIPDVPYDVTTPTSGELVAGQTWTYDVSQHVNLAGQTATYSISSVDPTTTGISIDEASGVVTGQVTSADSYSVTVNLAEQTTTGDLPTLTVSGTGAWTFGQPFKQGDVPEYLAVSGGGQADIRNRWPDGSVKFAVISAVNAGSVTFSRTATAPSSSEVALSSSPASVTFTGAVTGTYACPTTNTVGTWNKASAHLVRKIAGPVMTERHYYVPTTDAHVAVWFHVRSYSNGATWVETIIENGWARVASPAERAYGVTVTVGGTSRYSASLVHYSHTRWSRQDWVGADPGITPQHDAAYLKSTKLVPNYAPQLTAEATLAALSAPSTPAPFTRYGFAVNSAAGGSAPWLALLSRWDVAYIQTGDVRAYRSVLAHEQASNCCYLGSDHNIVRDEATGLPPALTSYYSDSWSNGYSPTYGAGKVYLGVNSTNNAESGAKYVWRTDGAHGWNAGYLPYLVTGRWFSLETCQMHACGTFLNGGMDTTPDAIRLGEDRACAWDFRSYAAALAVTPDSQTTLQTAFKSYAETYLSYWYTNEVGFNNLGIRKNVYNNVDYGPAPYNTCGAFQQYFVMQAFSWGRDVASHIVGSTAQMQWTEAVQFHGQFTTGLLGTRPGGHCFRRAGTYAIVIGPNRTKPLTASSFYADFGTLYDARVTTGQIPSGEACALTGADSTLLYGSDDPYDISGTSYFGNMTPAAAYAVDVGTTGAAASWARLTDSASWPTFYANWALAPEYGVLPR